MWQRWNQSTHIFEKSDNDGASWTPLPLNASIITEGTIPGVAYLAAANSFSGGNVFSARTIQGGGSGTSYAGSQLEIQSGYPRVSFHWPGVVASQIGMDSGGTIRTYDNPGTGFASFSALDVNAYRNFHNLGGYVYPGRADANGGYQTSWYLGSHGAYGLYSNTGLYLESNIWANAGSFRANIGCWYVEATAHIRAATGLYDYARGTPIGDWIQWLPGANYFWSDAGTWTVTSYDIRYSIVGHTLQVVFAVHASSLSASNTVLHCYLPGTGIGLHQGACGVMQLVHDSNPPYSGMHFLSVPASVNYWNSGIIMGSNSSIPAGNIRVYGQLTVAIQ